MLRTTVPGLRARAHGPAGDGLFDALPGGLHRRRQAEARAGLDRELRRLLAAIRANVDAAERVLGGA